MIAFLCYLSIIYCNVRVSRFNNAGMAYGPDLADVQTEVSNYVAKPFGGRSLKVYVADKYLEFVQTNDTFLQTKFRYVHRTQSSQQAEVATLAAWAAWSLLT